MSEQRFPSWNEDRVKRLIAHYRSLTEVEQVAEDEAAVTEQRWPNGCNRASDTITGDSAIANEGERT
jgi:hypothetical protein